MEWLRNNMNKFKKPVYEPIMMVLRVTNEKYSLHLENAIGNQELEAFVCEDQQDMNVLMNALRKDLNLHKINVVHSAPSPNDNMAFKHPNLQGVTVGKVFLDEVLSDDCPLAVRKHLCKKKHLHMIPVFDRDPGACANIRKYYVGKKRFEVSMSRYSNRTSKSVDSLESEQIKYLEINTVKDASIGELENEIEELKGQIKGHTDKIAKNSSFINRKKDEEKGLQNVIDDLEAQLNQVDAIEKKIFNLVTQIKQMKSGEDITKLKEKAVSDRIVAVKELAKANQQLLKLVAESNAKAVKFELNETLIAQIHQ